MTSEKPRTTVGIMRDHIELMAAELECWRKRHPIERRYVAEEARAKVERREPRYIPPVAIF